MFTVWSNFAQRIIPTTITRKTSTSRTTNTGTPFPNPIWMSSETFIAIATLPSRNALAQVLQTGCPWGRWKPTRWGRKGRYPYRGSAIFTVSINRFPTPIYCWRELKEATFSNLQTKAFRGFQFQKNSLVRSPTAVKIAPSNADVAYFCANNIIYKTTDGGINWANVYSVSGGIYEIMVHPTNPNVVFIVGGQGAWSSTNGGTSWNQLQNNRCWDIRYHVTDPNIMFLLMENPTLNPT